MEESFKKLLLVAIITLVCSLIFLIFYERYRSRIDILLVANRIKLKLLDREPLLIMIGSPGFSGSSISVPWIESRSFCIVLEILFEHEVAIRKTIHFSVLCLPYKKIILRPLRTFSYQREPLLYSEKGFLYVSIMPLISYSKEEVSITLLKIHGNFSSRSLLKYEGTVKYAIFTRYWNHEGLCIIEINGTEVVRLKTNHVEVSVYYENWKVVPT